MTMGLRRWLATRFPDWPVNRVARVATDDVGLRLARVSGDHELVPWNEVVRVLIRTTDKGPFDDDVFFVLETTRESLVIPQPARGCAELLSDLQKLPGFDNNRVIEAMGCAVNREFLCWEREATG
jgi:hypothetical protein